MNDDALANGDIREFGGLAIFCDVRGCSGEFHVNGFAVLGFYGDRFRADFFNGSNDVFFVAVRESRRRNHNCEQKYNATEFHGPWLLKFSYRTMWAVHPAWCDRRARHGGQAAGRLGMTYVSQRGQMV